MDTPTTFDPSDIQQAVAEALAQQMAALNAAEQDEDDGIEEFDPEVESIDAYLQRMVFPDPFDFISIGEGKEIYRRDGFYFRRVNRVMLQREVSNFLRQHMKKSLKAKLAEDVVKLLLMDAEITGDEWVERCNPDGYLNCTNGVLRILPCGVKLLERDDDEVQGFIFLDKPVVTYDPDADRTHAQQLMFGSLEGESRLLYQRVIGASLNVSAVRQAVDRIPALNSPNTTGANGKSANNGMAARVHGPSAVASLGLEYFLSKKGDDPSRNDLWMLAGKKLNIPAESDSNFNLSNLALLKAAITGDPIKSRGLFKDAFDFSPRCVFHFSLNNSTIINGTSEATTTRWRLLDWPYSFVAEPVHAHQKKGEPRLNPTGGDFDFIDEHVLPGYLNLMIDGFMDACLLGFPDEESKKRLEENTAQHDHVADFLLTMGLEQSDPNGKPFISQRDLHQLYLYWLKHSKLEKDDDAYDAIFFAVNECRVDDKRAFQRDSKYDSLKETQAALADHLRNRRFKITRPNTRTCENLGIARETWCWLQPAGGQWNDALKQAVWNVNVPSIVANYSAEKAKLCQGATSSPDEFQRE